MDALYSVEDAARRLGGISKWTIHAWLSKGRLQRTKVGGRTMIRESELQKVIEDGGKSAAPKRSHPSDEPAPQPAAETPVTETVIHRVPPLTVNPRLDPRRRRRDE